jgi:hypothetical protein
MENLFWLTGYSTQPFTGKTQATCWYATSATTRDASIQTIFSWEHIKIMPKTSQKKAAAARDIRGPGLAPTAIVGTFSRLIIL